MLRFRDPPGRGLTTTFLPKGTQNLIAYITKYLMISANN